MIKVVCNTDLAAYKSAIWPTRLACRPEIGDFVLSKNGLRLKVCEITHSQREVSFGAPRLGDENYESILIIELHN